MDDYKLGCGHRDTTNLYIGKTRGTSHWTSVSKWVVRRHPDIDDRYYITITCSKCGRPRPHSIHLLRVRVLPFITCIVVCICARVNIGCTHIIGALVTENSCHSAKYVCKRTRIIAIHIFTLRTLKSWSWKSEWLSFFIILISSSCLVLLLILSRRWRTWVIICCIIRWGGLAGHLREFCFLLLRFSIGIKINVSNVYCISSASRVHRLRVRILLLLLLCGCSWISLLRWLPEQFL